MKILTTKTTMQPYVHQHCEKRLCSSLLVEKIDRKYQRICWCVTVTEVYDTPSVKGTVQSLSFDAKFDGKKVRLQHG